MIITAKGRRATAPSKVGKFFEKRFTEIRKHLFHITEWPIFTYNVLGLNFFLRQPCLIQFWASEYGPALKPYSRFIMLAFIPEINVQGKRVLGLSGRSSVDLPINLINVLLNCNI